MVSEFGIFVTKSINLERSPAVNNVNNVDGGDEPYYSSRKSRSWNVLERQLAQ